MDEENDNNQPTPPVSTEPIGSVSEADIKKPAQAESPMPAPAQTPKTDSIEDKTFFKTRMGHIMLAAFVLVMIGGTAATLYLSNRTEETTNTVGQLNTEPLNIEESTQDAEPINVLDYTALPLGDGKFTTDGPRQGFVYSCEADFNLGSTITQRPWIETDADTWDLTKKVSVDGSVSWPTARWDVQVETGTRVLTSAGLPVGHNTGTFPVAASDDANQYVNDAYEIQEQDLSLTLPLIPSELTTPQCIGDEVGISLTGALIFSALNADGRDAVATDLLDSCQGHVHETGHYHYHGYSSCFDDDSADDEHSDLLGYAFDGFGIYGLKGEDGVEMTSADLDECHGHTHNIEWDGEEVSIYHYHFTQDYPYTVSCFKGEPLVRSLTVGEGVGGMMGDEMDETDEEAGPGGPREDLPPPPITTQ